MGDKKYKVNVRGFRSSAQKQNHGAWKDHFHIEETYGKEEGKGRTVLRQRQFDAQ